jgi:hypothetical protein
MATTIGSFGSATDAVVNASTFATGANATDRVTINGFYYSPANVSVTVPSITDPDIAQVAVDVSGSFAIQPAVGDLVIVAPMEALPTNCRFQGAYVSATDEVTICFGSEGGNVTGAAKNFRMFIIDVT